MSEQTAKGETHSVLFDYFTRRVDLKLTIIYGLGIEILKIALTNFVTVCLLKLIGYFFFLFFFGKIEDFHQFFSTT